MTRPDLRRPLRFLRRPRTLAAAALLVGGACQVALAQVPASRSVAPAVQPSAPAAAAPGTTAPAGLPSPSPFPAGLPSPNPFPAGIPAAVPAAPAIPANAPPVRAGGVNAAGAAAGAGGTIVVPPGTTVLTPGGTVVGPGGSVTTPGGTVVTPGGVAVPGGTIDPSAQTSGTVPIGGAVVGGPGIPATPQSTPMGGPGPFTALQVAQSFIHADANRDGDLTRAEALRLSIKPFSFEEMDRDGDGILSRSEYEEALR